MIRSSRALANVALVLVLAAVLTSVGPAGSALAQGSTDDALRDLLRRTDEGLARAEEIVHESQSRRAREVLARAVQVQASAWNQYHAGHPRIAQTLTNQAYELGKRALVLARDDRQLRNRAERELERARHGLRRAVEEIGPNASEPQRRLLEEARAQLERGRRLFGEQHYEAAIRLAISCQRLTHQAVGLGGNGGPGGAGHVLRELERTDRLIDRATPPIRESGNVEAVRLLDRGVELQAQARHELRNGRARVALSQTREARGLVNRALGLVRGPVDVERVSLELSRTDDMLGRAADAVREADNESARRILESAREHQDRARRLLDDEELRPALAQTLVARRLATRAIREAEKGSTP